MCCQICQQPRSVCYNKDAAVSPARLVRGLIGAYNERPHGDSTVPPYSVKARLGLMRSALAATKCVFLLDTTVLWIGMMVRMAQSQARVSSSQASRVCCQVQLVNLPRWGCESSSNVTPGARAWTMVSSSPKWKLSLAWNCLICGVLSSRAGMWCGSIATRWRQVLMAQGTRGEH